MIIDGIVEQGKHLGRQLGFPTANIRPEGVSGPWPENGVYVAYGNSCIASPWAEFIAHADEKEQIIYGDIDLDRVDAIRQQLPLLKHRRPELY